MSVSDSQQEQLLSSRECFIAVGESNFKACAAGFAVGPGSERGEKKIVLEKYIAVVFIHLTGGGGGWRARSTFSREIASQAFRLKAVGKFEKRVPSETRKLARCDYSVFHSARRYFLFVNYTETERRRAPTIIHYT